MKNLQTLIIALTATSAEGFSFSHPRRLPTHRRRSAMTMYFDDITRKSPQIPWTPKHDQIRFATMPKAKSPDYTFEKLDMLQKMLYGHDASSAKSLTEAEIENATSHWMESVSFANAFLFVADSDFEYSVFMNNSTSVVGCLSYLWNHIDNLVKNGQRGEIGTHIFDTNIDLVVFPNCPALYNYEIMSRVASEIMACSDECNMFGKDFVVSAFHPHFENEPKMLAPERHSPFPTFGIHGVLDHLSPVKEDLNAVTFLGLDVGKPRRDKDNEHESLRNDMQSFDKTRDKLEALFNSVAASHVDCPDIDTKNRDEYDEYFISATQDWMGQNSKDFANIGKWEVSDSTLEESIYAEIWSLIHHFEDEIESYSNKNTRVASTMFVATKFSMYNAQRFKRMAITVNKTLKKSNANISMDLFHPEFVGKTEAQSQMRQSPFPSLQFITGK